MADEKSKTLEMRVAELEDKLSKMHISEEEMKAYQKVSSLMGQATSGGTALSPITCTIYRCIINPICIVRPLCIIRPVCECFECSCGPCMAGGGGVGGSGFGSFGM